MTSILIIRTSAIGDVIQTLPVLEYLATRFPTAHITWVVEQGIGSFLRQIGGDRLTQVLEISTRRWASAPFSIQTYREIRDFYQQLRKTNYTVLFDLQGNAKSALITFLARADDKVGFGKQSVREKINLLATTTKIDVPLTINIRLKYLSLPQTYFDGKVLELNPSTGQSASLTNTLMVAVGSKWRNKRLNEGKLLLLLERISKWKDPVFLFIFGNEQEQLLAERLTAHFPKRARAVGNLSLSGWRDLMAQVDGVIAVDSAALHLAGTTETPTFSLFGPTQASIFKPLGDRHHTVQGRCPYGRVFIKQCPVLRTCPTGACIQEISINELFIAFQEWYLIVENRSLVPQGG